MPSGLTPLGGRATVWVGRTPLAEGQGRTPLAEGQGPSESNNRPKGNPRATPCLGEYTLERLAGGDRPPLFPPYWVVGDDPQDGPHIIRGSLSRAIPLEPYWSITSRLHYRVLPIFRTFLGGILVIVGFYSRDYLFTWLHAFFSGVVLRRK